MVPPIKKPNLSQWILIILATLFFLTPLVFSKGFVDKYNPPKEIFVIVLTFCSLAYFGVLFLSRKISIALNKVDLLFIVFNLLYIISYLFQPAIFESFNIKLFSQISLLVFYFILKHLWANCKVIDSLLLIRILLLSLILIAFIQSILGCFQLLNDNLPKGTFDNSGPYTNYLSIVVSLAFGGLLLKVFSSRWTNVFLVFFIIVTVTILIITKSRTAWISTIIGFLLVLYWSADVYPKLKKIKSSKVFRYVLVPMMIISFLALGSYMYQLKKDSANGRVLIWKTTIQTISEKPIFGHGAEGFLSSRNHSQSMYFENNWGNEYEKYLADDIEFAFNDFLQITAEIGLIGLFVFVLLLYFLFSVKTGDRRLLLIKIGMLVLLTTSLFSYSLQKISIYMLFVFFVSFLSYEQDKETLFSIQLKNLTSKIVGTVLIIFSALVVTLSTRTVNAYFKWKDTHQMMQDGDREIALLLYYKLNFILKSDPYFLYNYGTVLSIENQYTSSIRKLEECKIKLYDSDVLTNLGNNYWKLGDFKKAEGALLEAIHVIPHKFIPRYQLVLLYIEMGELETALVWAFEILNEKPKVPSKVVDDIKNEMVQFVTAFSKNNQ